MLMRESKTIRCDCGQVVERTSKHTSHLVTQPQKYMYPNAVVTLRDESVVILRWSIQASEVHTLYVGANCNTWGTGNEIKLNGKGERKKSPTRNMKDKT